MRIWIDLDNSPHVLFFAPIIRELSKRGVDVLITVREFSQTRELARQHGLEFKTVGRHHESGATVIKVVGTLYRAAQLMRAISKERITVGISHGSRALVLAGRALRLPVMTLYDYEFASYRLYNVFSRRILAPEVIPDGRLVAQGLDLSKLVRYPGLKEEVYVYNFRPNLSITEKLGLDRQKLIVTVRPPATWAHYHDERSTLMFSALIKKLQSIRDAQVIIPARTESQARELRSRYELPEDRFQILTHPLDGLSLMWCSDLVFSGGGTMTREAALLGIDVYSIFGGRLGAGDESLIRAGKLSVLRQPAEIEKVRFVRRQTPLIPPFDTKRLALRLADEIESFAREFVAC
jgi:predicted glycosyltransferase